MKGFFGQTRNTILVSSMRDGKFTDAGMQDAAEAARILVGAMRAKAEEQKLAGVQYFIVGSSGVAAGENKDELAKRVQEATNIQMDFIDAKREGYFGLESSVPKPRIPVSTYIDIGSGNTKLGCVVGTSELANYRSAEIKYGSVTGSSEAKKRNAGDIVAGVKDVMTDVTAEYIKDSENIPCLRNRQRIYWTGGAAWATATFMHPELSMAARVEITRKDVDDFVAKLTDDTWNQTTPKINYSPSSTPAQRTKIRAQAEKDRQDVMDVFVREQLLSGVSIMKTVLHESNRSATIVFVRENGYIYGYALEKYFHEEKTEQRSASR